MNLTIRQLIDELRAASEVVGEDAEVEGVQAVITTTRSVKLDDGGESADLEKEIEELEKTYADDIKDLKDQINGHERKAKNAIRFLLKDEPDVKAAIEALE